MCAAVRVGERKCWSDVRSSARVRADVLTTYSQPVIAGKLWVTLVKGNQVIWRGPLWVIIGFR